MTEHYSIIRKIKRQPYAVPGHNLNNAFNEIKFHEISQRQISQYELNRCNNTTARELIKKIPEDTVFEINRMENICQRGQPETYREITYYAKISDKNETGKKMTVELSNGIKMKEEHPCPIAFCLETKLLLRDSNGLLIENKKLIESLYQNNAEMPQTRPIAE